MLNHERNKHILEVSLDGHESDGWLDDFAANFADLLSESDRWFAVDEARNDLHKLTRSEILNNAGYPLSLVVRAK